tara:strand:+ start:12199 stop:12396 length:198 start_codon:yes stop_codon:yes gene_type:complete
MKHNKTLISFIIPFYYNKNLLKKYAINLNLICKNIPVEIIYIDNGSTYKEYENLLKLNLENNLFI